jgi:hypothetical protein
MGYDHGRGQQTKKKTLDMERYIEEFNFSFMSIPQHHDSYLSRP